MAQTKTRAIVIENDNGDAAGTLHVRCFDLKDRVLRALAALGVMWMLALISVLIPVAHFVLVPALLLAGPVVAVLRFRVTEINELAEGSCPTCGGLMTIEMDASDHLPMWTYCPPGGHPIHLLDARGVGH